MATGRRHVAFFSCMANHLSSYQSEELVSLSNEGKGMALIS